MPLAKVKTFVLRLQGGSELRWSKSERIADTFFDLYSLIHNRYRDTICDNNSLSFGDSLDTSENDFSPPPSPVEIVHRETKIFRFPDFNRITSNDNSVK